MVLESRAQRLVVLALGGAACGYLLRRVLKGGGKTPAPTVAEVDAAPEESTLNRSDLPCPTARQYEDEQVRR